LIAGSVITHVDSRGAVPSNSVFVEQVLAFVVGLILLAITVLLDRWRRRAEHRSKQADFLDIVAGELNWNIHKMHQIRDQATAGTQPLYALRMTSREAVWPAILDHHADQQALIEECDRAYAEYALINRTLELYFIGPGEIRHRLLNNSTLPLINAELPRTHELRDSLRNRANAIRSGRWRIRRRM
jgi:hypothetical protein